MQQNSDIIWRAVMTDVTANHLWSFSGLLWNFKYRYIMIVQWVNMFCFLSPIHHWSLSVIHRCMQSEITNCKTNLHNLTCWRWTPKNKKYWTKLINKNPRTWNLIRQTAMTFNYWQIHADQMCQHLGCFCKTHNMQVEAVWFKIKGNRLLVVINLYGRPVFKSVSECLYFTALPHVWHLFNVGES